MVVPGEPRETEAFRSVTVRELSPADYLAVSELIPRVIEASWSDIRPPEVIARNVEKYNAPERIAARTREIRYWVAEDNHTHQIVGIIGLSQHNELRTFFVDSAYQGQKVGRQLYAQLEAYARV